MSCGRLPKGALAFLALMTVVMAAAPVGAAQIYFDDFSGSDVVDLNGTTPDVSATGASWVARSNYKADGSFSWEGNAAMSLAFTPVDGRVYTLDVKIENLSGAHWTQFGFGNGADPDWKGRVWHLLRVVEQATAPHAAFADGWGSSQDWSDLATLKYDEPLDARIVLDTTGGSGSWLATWYGKADSDPDYTEVRPPTLLTLEDIDSVGFDLFNTNKTGRLLSFSLSDDLGVGIPGDFNRDEQVDQGDLSLLLVNWGRNTGEPPDGWHEEAWDPAVDQEELSALLANWGAGAGGAAAVPEPSTCALFCLALLGSLGFARRKR